MDTFWKFHEKVTPLEPFEAGNGGEQQKEGKAGCPPRAFRELIRLSSFFLPVSWNKGSNKGQISFCPINFQNGSIPNQLYLLKAGGCGYGSY